MPTSTTNYALQKPLVNDPTDEDLWGDELNDDLDDIDGLLKQGITLTNQVTQTTGFTATATISTKYLYPCDATIASYAATLPTAASAGNGGTVAFKKMDATANTITVTRAGSDTIDGVNTKILTTQYEFLALASDGVSAWRVINTTAAVFTGDSGSGGTTGLVPAPAAGDTASQKFLKANASWTRIFADAAETAAGTSTSLAVTPGSLAGSKSLASNGYIKFPGLWLQWGQSVANPAGTAVVFPVAFTTAVLNIQLTINNDVGDGANPPVPINVTTSGFTAKCLDLTNTVYWFAIGY